MALSGCSRSNLTLIAKIVKAESVLAQRSGLLGSSEVVRNYATATPSKEAKVRVPLALFGGAGTIPKWRNLLMLRDSLFQSSHSAAFHSTPVSLGKWKNKWDSQQDNERGQRPSKNYIRYTTRQKRADAKKALKDLLYRSGSTKHPFQDESTTWNTYVRTRCNAEQENDVHGSSKQFQSKRTAKFASRSSSRAGKNQHFGSKRKLKKESFDDFDVDSETIFEATFGNRCFTWSFRSWKENPSHSSGTFEWRENLNWTKNKKKAWDTSSETDDNEAEPCFVGSSSHRTILGLPLHGPLKMDDVKSAFRLSALKWHPDKHQGPSQVMAAEKFKLCVDAYKSLCSALSSA